MLLVRGKDVVEATAADLEALLAGRERLVLDVGTGDGRFAYALARERPDALVLGIDATRENLAEVSRKATRKPGKGGVPNVAYVWASAERPPPELAGRAHELHVVLPWGRLMLGLVKPSADILDGLARLARPGARLEAILNAEAWAEPVPIETRGLPTPTVEYVEGTLAPIYARHGIAIEDAGLMGRSEVRALRSTWARRLAHGRDPRFIRVRATVAGA